MKDKAGSCKFKRNGEIEYVWADLYSSLTPYAIVISESSETTDFAEAFIRSIALLSFGFSNAYLVHSLGEGQPGSNIQSPQDLTW